MKIKTLFGLLAVACAFGCTSGDSGGTATNSAPSGGAPSGEEFKVALLTPGPVNDAGWSAMAYEGLQTMKKDLGATVDNQEAGGTKIRDAMRSYAQKGYKLVIGHGYEYNEPAVEVAKDFPETVFVSSSGDKTAPNAGAFRFALEQGCYLAGYAAAKLSKTGKVGSVAVYNYPSIVSTLRAYAAGAKAANPNIVVIEPVYFGTEGDVAKAKQATEQVIAQGADFIIHQANAAASGVFAACKEGKVNAIGTNADQNGDSSGAVVMSAYIVAGPAFTELAKTVKDKRYKGEVQLFGMEKGGIDFAFRPDYESSVPEPLRSEIATLKENIKSGKVVVPMDKF